MLSELIGAGQAVKASFDILKAALGVKTSHEVSMALIDLNAKLLGLQGVANGMAAEITRLTQAVDEAAQRERALKKELAQHNEFDAEKHQYRLQQVAPGAFAYVKNAGGSEEAGVHQEKMWFCPQCFEQKRKSILQRAGYEPGDELFKCSSCGCTLRVRLESAGATVIGVARGRRMF